MILLGLGLLMLLLAAGMWAVPRIRGEYVDSEYNVCTWQLGGLGLFFILVVLLLGKI